MTPLPKLNRREKASLAILGAGAAALLVSSNLAGNGDEAAAAPLFNPEAEWTGSGAGSLLRRALSAPLEELRDLNVAITGYDTSEVRTLPAFYDNYKNIWETFTEQPEYPLLWYIPKAGGNTIAKLMAKCLEFVTASSMARTVEGGVDGDHLDSDRYDDNIGHYVNVDPSTDEGIDRARGFNLLQTNQVDLVVTQKLKKASELFDSTHRGRLFVMLRHPVKRAADQFYYRQRATWEESFDADLAKMSLEEYATSNRLVGNFVVRSLVGKVTPDVTIEDVELAKDVLRRKFLVGIAEPKWFDLSIVRFEKYFGWWDDKQVLTNHTTNYCHHREITRGQHFGNHPKTQIGTEARRKIIVRNWADLELYLYAKNTLFKQQSVLI